MSDSMRIRCISTSYPSYVGDASGNFVASLNQVFQNYDWHVEVIGPQKPAEAEPPSCEHYIGFKTFGGPFGKEGAPDWLMRHPIVGYCWAPWVTTALWYSIWSRDRKSNSTVTIAHWLLPTGLCALSSHPIIYAHGGDVALLERIPWGRAIASLIARRARGIIFVSEDLKQRFLNLCIDPPKFVFTCSMGVEKSQRYDPQNRQKWRKISAGRYIIVTVGRLTLIKGYHLLAEAILSLPLEIRSQICWIAGGEGPQKERLKEYQTLGVPLILSGYLTPDARDPLLQVADIFVQPSQRLGKRVEGSPVALMEALVAGCAVIGSNSGGIPAQLYDAQSRLTQAFERSTQVPSTRYLVFDTGDYMDLARCIQQLLKQGEELAKHRNIAEEAHELITWKHKGVEHMELINQIVHKA